tara:strand:+ start:48 stop:1079 length:1032 start_codon:yes stop_codon:yes gene_type:complete
MDYLAFSISVVLVLLINLLFIKKNILSSFSGDNHQKLASVKSIPLSGGIFLLFIFCVIFFKTFSLHFIFIISIFLIGLFSDLKILKSAKIRLILQSGIIFVFVIFFDLQITSTRLEFFDEVLSNKFISYLFVSFCILIIVNGSNFLDGLNTLVLGYYLLVSYIIYKTELYNFINLEPKLFLFWFFFLAFVYVVNFLNLLYLGDNGAYFLGFVYSFVLILIYNNYTAISPYFIILLLWYPGFENLFSIIRKKILKKNSPLLPDPKHLHQLMFMIFNKKLFKNKIYANLVVANIINIYNFLIFSISIQNISDTKFQLVLLLINITIYTFLYLFLSKILKKINNQL